MNITMDVEGLSDALKGLGELPKRARFAASLGMNRTMNEAQDAIRAKLDSDGFTLRRPEFVKATIYRKPGAEGDFASKDRLTAGVRINEQRNQLAKFEEGGEKTPRAHSFLAIPVDVKRNKRDIVGKNQSVAGLLATGKAYIRDGKVWLLQGRGKVKKRILAYVFKRSVKIAPQLHFVETGKAVIKARAEENIIGAMLQEFTTGLTTKSKGS